MNCNITEKERFLANRNFHPAQQMQQYADGSMQTRLMTDAATQRLSIDPQGDKGKRIKETGSSIALLSKYLYS